MQIYLPIAEMSVAVEAVMTLGITVGFLSGVFGIGDLWLDGWNYDFPTAEISGADRFCDFLALHGVARDDWVAHVA